MGLDRLNIGLIFIGCRSFLYSPSHDWRPQRLAIRAGKGQHGCSSMRKSKEVPITLLAALALSTTGCEPPQHSCVDSTGHLAPESYCQNQATGYSYVYGGSSGGHIGDAVIGASSSPSDAGVSRGGFGHGDGGAGGLGSGGE